MWPNSFVINQFLTYTVGSSHCCVTFIINSPCGNHNFISLKLLPAANCCQENTRKLIVFREPVMHIYKLPPWVLGPPCGRSSPPTTPIGSTWWPAGLTSPTSAHSVSDTHHHTEVFLKEWLQMLYLSCQLGHNMNPSSGQLICQF